MDSKGYAITSLDSIWFVNVPLSPYHGPWGKSGLSPPLPCLAQRRQSNVQCRPWESSQWNQGHMAGGSGQEKNSIKAERNVSLSTLQNLNPVPWAILSAPVIQSTKDGLHKVLSSHREAWELLIGTFVGLGLAIQLCSAWCQALGSSSEGWKLLHTPLPSSRSVTPAPSLPRCNHHSHQAAGQMQ